MKTFKLNSVAYKNIMSVGDTEIRIALDAHHKTLITGKNGGGKSTMLEAITFALFGKPFRDIKKGQLVNSVTKKALLVELAMEYDGHVFEIARGLLGQLAPTLLHRFRPAGCRPLQNIRALLQPNTPNLRFQRQVVLMLWCRQDQRRSIRVLRLLDR